MLILIILFLLLKTAYAPVVTYQPKDNQKLSKVLNKGFETSVYWNECKTKSEKKDNMDIFSNQTLIKTLTDCLFQFIQIKIMIQKDLKLKNSTLPKDVIKNYNVVISGKNFYDQPIDPDIKRYKETRLTTEQGENYTTGCLLDYEYIKNHGLLIVVDLSRQNKLDADLKAI